MGLEGRKIEDNKVVFGEPATGKALQALQRNSPTAESILSSLPPSAFIPIQQETTLVEEDIEKKEKAKQELDEKVNMTKYRRERKRKQSLLKEKKESHIKKSLEEPKEEATVEKTSIEKIIETSNKEEELMNLEDELAALEKEVAAKKAEKEKAELQKMSEEIQAAPQEEQPEMKDQILELLKSDPNAPGIETINAWKERFGKNGLHVMAFGEDDVYIYHHLTRGEWKKIKELMTRLSETDEQEEIEEKLKEKVVLYCVLYPSVDENWLEYCKAGILDSLYQMILLNSGFLTPQQAMLLTTQL
jgi:hypothetical protein